MSVIHEALRRARESRLVKKNADPAAPKASLTVKSTRQMPAWVLWLMLFFVLAEGALYLKERNGRLHAQDKMRMAYLELNDSRGEFLQKRETQIRTASDLRELKARMEKILSQTKEVEYDNVTKEKKIADLTKELHGTEMEKYRLEGRIKGLEDEMYDLKAELAIARSSVLAPQDASN